jgi:hypothetical protein
LSDTTFEVELDFEEPLVQRIFDQMSFKRLRAESTLSPDGSGGGYAGYGVLKVGDTDGGIPVYVALRERGRKTLLRMHVANPRGRVLRREQCRKVVEAFVQEIYREIVRSQRKPGLQHAGSLRKAEKDKLRIKRSPCG